MAKKPKPKAPKTAKNPAQSPAEYDRRGIQLPARTAVGGIITPV
jgi:hypothetical protein